VHCRLPQSSSPPILIGVQEGRGVRGRWAGEEGLGRAMGGGGGTGRRQGVMGECFQHTKSAASCAQFLRVTRAGIKLDAVHFDIVSPEIPGARVSCISIAVIFDQQVHRNTGRITGRNIGA